MGNEVIDIKISDIGETITGKTPSSSTPEDFGNEFMFITPSDEFDKKYISTTNRYLSNVGYDRLKSKSLKPYSVLVSCIGSAMGKVVMNADFAITNQQINSIVVNEEKFSSHYVYYLLKNSYNILRNAASGSTALPLLNKSDFDELNFKVHINLIAQQKIAAVLSVLDDKIELNNKINAELEAMAKALYDYWFVQFDFPNVEGKPYKSSGGKMVFNETLKREIPEGWEVKKIGALSAVLSRGISPIYLDSTNGGIAVINQKCVRDHRVKYEFQRRHNDELKSADTKLIEKYDVLVNSTGVGTLGRVALVRWLNEGKVTVDSHVTIIRANDIIINKIYFGYSLLNKQQEIENFANGSTGQVELNRSQLSDVDIIIPPSNLQSKFSEYYNLIIEKTSVNEKQNVELTTLRDWLLPMLMNGQVKVGEVE